MEKGGRPRTALNESVKVVVRCRPLSEKESLEGYDEKAAKNRRNQRKWYERLSAKPLEINGSDVPSQVVKVWPERGAVQVYNPKGQDKLFTFDAAYDSDADTQTIYDEMIRPLVSSVLDGFNGCVFAYGQTGTGKTHTMEGTAADEGIIPRAFRHIWAHIETSASSDVTHLVSCSYVELYLEDVRDLLSNDCKKLTIRAQQELNGFYIPEMTSLVCKSAADMMRAMRAGNKVRAAGKTDMNEHSSRSHAVFLVTVETQHRDSNKIRVGKLNLVDLAGSERQRKTHAANERLKEAARINQALSSLGNVISALAENSPHVPYRDSKLTRILQDSLGGNSKTTMVATLGPAAYNYDETLTTLRYASRAKSIKNKPVRNEDPKDAKLREYQAEIERLRALIDQRKMIEKKRREKPARTRDSHDHSEEETASLLSEQQAAAAHVEAARGHTEELEQRIRALEARLVLGGAAPTDLLDHVARDRARLDQRRHQIAERKQREVEMQQRIELEEETAAIVTNTFTTLQQEVDHKTQRIKKCMAKYSSVREEAAEQRDAHDADRREQDDVLAALAAALRRKLLVADSFVRDAGRAAAARLRCSDDLVWLDPPPVEPLSRRPVANGTRRPAAAAARGADNLLALRPLPLPPTTRAYPPPTARAYPPPTARPAPPAHPAPPPALEAVRHKDAPPKPRARPLTAHRAGRLGTAGAR